MFRCVLLYSTSFPSAIKHLELWINNFLYELVGFGGEHCTLGILLKDFDARLVHQEGVVENMEFIVEDAERVALRHLVTLPFPAQSLVVMWVHVSANVDWLPVDEIASTLANVENPEI
jgi:hypothetical protein